MRHPIAKALVLSFLLHYVFVLLFLHFGTELTIEKSLPTLNLELLARNDGTHAEESALAEDREDAGARAGSVVEEQEAFDAVNKAVVEISQRVAEEPRRGSPQQARAASSVQPAEEEPAADHAVAATLAGSGESPYKASEVVSAASQSGWSMPTGRRVAAAPAPEKVPVSDPDRDMLEKKFRKWGEDFNLMEEEATDLEWEHQGHAYTASFRRLPPRGDMDMGHVVVEVTKEEGGTRFTTEMRMKNLAFSNYAQFVDRWNPNVEIHDDETDGRFHSNSEINLAYSSRTWPVFFGKVTTSYRRINTTGYSGLFRRSQIFLGGLETGVKKIVMPKQYSPFPGEEVIGDDQVRIFEADARITFYPDGTYGWRYVDSEEPGERIALSGQGAYLVGAGKTVLHVRGTLDGKALVYSPKKIIVEGDLVYARPPDAVPESDDFLGLVTDGSIEIAGPKVTGPGDLRINAAMYAKRRFVVRYSSTKNKGTLVVHGSLAAGSMSATEPRFGTRFRFDRRLEDLRPPRFPLTDRYESLAWDGEWEVQAHPPPESPTVDPSPLR